MSEYIIVAGRGKVKKNSSPCEGCKVWSSGGSGEQGPRLSSYERTKQAVYATGNKWAIENFHATHD